MLSIFQYLFNSISGHAVTGKYGSQYLLYIIVIKFKFQTTKKNHIEIKS